MRFPWRPRPSIRLRLTILYTLLFLGAGAVLLGLTYGLVDRALAQRFRVVIAGGSAGRALPVDTSLRVYVTAADTYLRWLQAEVLHDLLVQSSIALGVTTVLTVGLGWVMAGRALRPVHRITATARRLSRENLGERIALQGPQDELMDLADTFDAMLDRLEAAFESQHRFVANASHELRTPLAVQRTLIDVALRDPAAGAGELRSTLGELRDVVAMNERLIAGLFLLARSERGLEALESVDLRVETEQVVAQARAKSARRGIIVRGSSDHVAVAGDRALLRRLVENLVENAVHHNVERGWVEVSLRANGSGAVLTVANGGETVSEPSLLFEPFRRLGRERTDGNGAGLGLSIVRAIARAHGGSVSASAPGGGGLVVTVQLPAQVGFARH